MTAVRVEKVKAIQSPRIVTRRMVDESAPDQDPVFYLISVTGRDCHYNSNALTGHLCDAMDNGEIGSWKVEEVTLG